MLIASPLLPSTSSGVSDSPSGAINIPQSQPIGQGTLMDCGPWTIGHVLTSIRFLGRLLRLFSRKSKSGEQTLIFSQATSTTFTFRDHQALARRDSLLSSVAMQLGGKLLSTSDRPQIFA